MNHLFNLRRDSHSIRQIAGMTLALALLCTLTAGAMAQVGTVASFSLNLSSSEQILANPNDPTVMHFQSWDSPLTRIIERNMPFLELTNSATSTVNLTEFRFTIGDTNYNFGNGFLGDYAVLGTTTPGIDFNAVSGGDELVMQFNNGGLAPGETVRFQVDIDADPGFMTFAHPDYRTVFFDIIGQSASVADDSDNSLATALFLLSDDSIRGVSQRLQDISAGSDNVFVNGNIRPYSIMEMVEFEPVGEPDPDPEPGADPNCIVLSEVNMMGMINDAIQLTNVGDAGTAIDILDFMILGDDADLFDLKDFEPTQVIAGEGPTSFGLLFTGAPFGDYDAQIVLQTSEGDFTYHVCAEVDVIPEPTSIALLAFASIGWTATGRRFRR